VSDPPSTTLAAAWGTRLTTKLLGDCLGPIVARMRLQLPVRALTALDVRACIKKPMHLRRCDYFRAWPKLVLAPLPLSARGNRAGRNPSAELFTSHTIYQYFKLPFNNEVVPFFTRRLHSYSFYLRREFPFRQKKISSTFTSRTCFTSVAVSLPLERESLFQSLSL
jgi:hypothetical protein